MGGLAAPMFDAYERPVAALGTSGPLDRVTVSRMKEWAPRVLEVAGQLSKGLGYARGYFGESV